MKAMVMVVATKTVVEMITVTILDISQSPAKIIIRMSISTIIDITVIGIRGIRGNNIKEAIPIMRGMAIMKDIITNCFSCSMMASTRLCSQSVDRMNTRPSLREQ
jgi:hypothetical protein